MLEKTIFVCVCVCVEVGGHLLVPSLWKSTYSFQEDPWAQSLPPAPSELLGVSFSKHAPYIRYHTGVFTCDAVCQVSAEVSGTMLQYNNRKSFGVQSEAIFALHCSSGQSFLSRSLPLMHSFAWNWLLQGDSI